MPQLPAKAASSSVTAMPPSLMSCPAEILSSAIRLWVVLYMAFRLLTSTSGVSLPSWLYTCRPPCYSIFLYRCAWEPFRFLLDELVAKQCCLLLRTLWHADEAGIHHQAWPYANQAAQAVHRFVQESLGVRGKQAAHKLQSMMGSR